MPMSNIAGGRVSVAVLASVVVITLAVACKGGSDGTQTPQVDETPAVAATASPMPSPRVGTPDVAAGISMIPVLKFDKAELAVKQGMVTITADNTDTGNRHSFAVFLSRASAEVGEGLVSATEICLGPCVESVTFETPPPGEYFFRCQVHPTRMTGTFIVE